MSYNLKAFYEEKVSVILNTGSNDKTLATIGMRRKGIAIAKYDNTIGLIDDTNHVIFSIERYGEDFNGKYSYDIKRSFEGLYILTWEGYKKNKNWDTFLTTSYRAFDENGHEINCKNYDFENTAYPIEMGCGLILYNNIIYDINTLESVIHIPSKFQPKGIFTNNICHLLAVEDYHDYIVLVKDHEITKIDNYDNVKNILLKIKDSGIVTNFSKSFYFDITLLTELEKRLFNAWVHVVHDNGHIAPFNIEKNKQIAFINNTIPLEEFDNTNSLPQQFVTILYNINNIINSNNLQTAILNFSPSCTRFCIYYATNIKCFIYKNFYVLNLYHHGTEYYRFYNKEGNNLCYQTFNELSINKMPIKYDVIWDRHIFDYNFYSSDYKAVIINNGILKQIPLSPKYYLVEKKNYIELRSRANSYCSVLKYYNFELEEIFIKYTLCTYSEIIKNYLYCLDLPFTEPDDYKYNYIPFDATSKRYYLFGHLRMDFEPSTPAPVLKDNTLYLPDPKSYNSVINEINARHDNRPKYIDSVNYLFSYYDGTDEIQVFKFEYRPWGIMTDDGTIYYTPQPFKS